MFAWLSQPEGWIALVTLTALEIVLGIDNIIFISILVDRLPAAQRHMARNLGLIFAMISRLALLFFIAWIIGLTKPWVTILGQALSGRDLILLAGGLFLLVKATHEIHSNVEGFEEHHQPARVKGLGAFLLQVGLIDLVFSLDSVITAVGMVQHLSIMVTAIIIAVGVMLWAAKGINTFITEHPTIKILALAFLIMVGVTLIVAGFDVHVPKGYIYFAMAFSFGVEMLNLRMRKKRVAKASLTT